MTAKLKQKKAISAAVFSAVARRLVFGFLSKIEVGRVIVNEGSQRREFGNNDEIVAHIEVKDPRFYSRLVSGGSVGSGEAFIEGWWDSSNVTAVIELFAANIKVIDRIEAQVEWLKTPFRPIAKLFSRNTKRRAKKNIEAHYDLGNELYSRFLDPTMLYSAAIYPNDKATLHEASINKLKVICESLQLKSSDHLVEIGTGWGGLAIYAAETYGCRVTTTTISEEQHAYVEKLIEQKQLGDKIQLLKKDYRDLTGQFDKLVSIEMIEAVGHEYFDEYFAKCDSLLKSSGRMLIQSILIDHSRYDTYRKGEDFIQKYIFPGGALPSKEVVYDTVERTTKLQADGYFSFGYDYARTLADWRATFNRNWEAIRAHGYDEKFRRMWNFYFHYCEGGFWQDRIDVAHFVFAKR
ncbi:MAG: class I SAM-dependent methyltransferase [Gammaproteobacteria bacterium]|nr:class I SAM-dependent methyltransferase [Gammaproteobacteria bacterium]